ncbi:hypothetical protein DPMN_069973 [Dreissena polymorpha]|uniref:Uncharacterized protein n=1 Tax=Dreissena polymorpha TaxID=45954 RepID=A0A9D3Z5B9_DREPO|nr:hypothetical protein DPMN_069973 [Dreissena polymorpha]
MPKIPFFTNTDFTTQSSVKYDHVKFYHQDQESQTRAGFTRLLGLRLAAGICRVTWDSYPSVGTEVSGRYLQGDMGLLPVCWD